MTYNLYPTSIIGCGKNLLVKSYNKEILEKLKNELGDFPSEWFFEYENIYKFLIKLKILKRIMDSIFLESLKNSYIIIRQ